MRLLCTQYTILHRSSMRVHVEASAYRYIGYVGFNCDIAAFYGRIRQTGKVTGL